MSKTADKPQMLLEHHLKALKLPTILAEYEKVARESAADGIDHPRYLLRLAELELIERERRLVDRRIRAAKFPAVKSLDTFDFLAIPALNKMLVLELARSEYVIRHDNIIALGNSESDSYCSSRHLLRTPALFVADFQTADAGVGGPQLLC